ncbi:hypothetical protein KCU81_g7280, partial [Aureobasidium melanogenum]|uniref:Uncharacterized protein n=1 Tax=Aureobasidium melanogenum (strain CBS 110374) TaxID=1043003 RepID=A0A074WK49_AURM1
MTYTRSMYDMPPPKLGERNEYWQLPRDCKPAGALAAACIINKTFPDVYGFLEEKFWEIVRWQELEMKRNPVKKTPPWARFILRTFGLSFLYEDEDLTAKERAHLIFPMFEEISDEEWLRRAAPLHYPYHTPESQKRYDEEMAFRRERRVREWYERVAAYKKGLRADRAEKRAKMRAQDPEDFSDHDSFVSEASFHSDSEFGDDVTAEEILDKLCATLRGMYKRGVKPSDPDFKEALSKAQDVKRVIERNNEPDAVIPEMPEPKWNIKLDENMNLTLLDFDNDPFLSPADEVLLDDVQGCFNTRDMRIMEEIFARWAKLADYRGKDKDQIHKNKKEHNRLLILFNRLSERVNASKDDGQANGDEDANDDDSKSGGDEDDSFDPESQPDWMRIVSKKTRLIVEASDMDVNPKHVVISSMTEEEELEYFARLHQLDRIECAQFRIEDERKARMAQEIKDKGNDIQWLHTRDREDFPTSPRISASSQTDSPPAPIEEAYCQHRSMGQKLTLSLFDGSTLKCFSAGPHHTREEEFASSSSASSTNKKSLIDRGAKKIARGIRKFKKLRRKVLYDDESSGYSDDSDDTVTCP